MLFSAREKSIYTAPGGETFDPVAVHYALVQASSGRLDALLAAWWGADTADADRAGAVTHLTKIARAAFSFKPFDQPGGKLDADVLETLYHFLDWLQKKE